MTYEFACGDVMPGCAATFDADDKDALFGKIAAHAKDEHGIEEITPELAQKVDALVTTS